MGSAAPRRHLGRGSEGRKAMSSDAWKCQVAERPPAYRIGERMNPHEQEQAVKATLEIFGEPPQLTIGLDEQLRKGIAQQLRTLSDLLDPPVA